MSRLIHYDVRERGIKWGAQGRLAVLVFPPTSEHGTWNMLPLKKYLNFCSDCHSHTHTHHKQQTSDIYSSHVDEADAGTDGVLAITVHRDHEHTDARSQRDRRRRARVRARVVDLLVH